jgi:hypothetical protein
MGISVGNSTSNTSDGGADGLLSYLDPGNTTIAGSACFATATPGTGTGDVIVPTTEEPALDLRLFFASPTGDTPSAFGLSSTGARTDPCDWHGDRAEGVAAPNESMDAVTRNMYAQLEVELDGVLGKGQYTKATNHYEYVQLVSKAMSQLSPDQQVAFKNRLEQIGQPLHINFGLSRNRPDNTPVALNTYAVNGFRWNQEHQEKILKQEFFDERDRALGRTH